MFSGSDRFPLNINRGNKKNILGQMDAMQVNLFLLGTSMKTGLPAGSGSNSKLSGA